MTPIVNWGNGRNGQISVTFNLPTFREIDLNYCRVVIKETFLGFEYLDIHSNGKNEVFYHHYKIPRDNIRLFDKVIPQKSRVEKRRVLLF